MVDVEDGFLDKIIAEIELLEQQPEQFNDISRIATLFMQHSKCGNVYLYEMIARLARDSIASKSQMRQQDEIILQMQQQLKTLTAIQHRVNSHQTSSGEGLQLCQAAVKEPIVEVRSSEMADIDVTMTNEPLLLDDSYQMGSPQRRIETAEPLMQENDLEGSVGVVTGFESLPMNQAYPIFDLTILTDGGLPGDSFTDMKRLEQQSQPIATDLSGGGNADEIVARLATESAAFKIKFKQQEEMILKLQKQLETVTGIHRMNSQAMQREAQQLHQPQIDVEPTVDISDPTQLEIAEIDTTNERSPLSDSSQFEQTVSGSEIASTEECSERSDIVARSNVSMIVERCNGSDIVQSLLQMKQVCFVRIKKMDEEEIKRILDSITAPPKRPRNLRNRTKTYSCGECKKQFIWKSSLTIHLRTHTEEKPFHCKDCGATLRRCDGLKIHQRIHTGVRPYSCKDCAASFRSSGALSRHRRIHSGEAPFKCKVCSATFNVSSNLKRHQRLHTGQKLNESNDCDGAPSQSGSVKSDQKIRSDKESLKKHFKIRP